MTSFFSSSYWTKPDAPVGAPAPDAAATAAAKAAADAAAEADALQLALAELRGDLDCAAGARSALPGGDPWRLLLADPAARSEIVLRVLRYQALHVARAAAQVRGIMRWRAAGRVCEIPAGAMRGAQAGLPCLFVPVLGAGRRTLVYVAARFYVKRDVVSDEFERGIIRFFETLLYAQDGLRASGSVVLADFSKLSIRECDLAITRRGIRIFLDRYPESFAKLIFVNYPRFIFHFWKLIMPLLDERTKERIVWCEAPGDVVTELGKFFDREQLPVWLGGASEKTKPELLIGPTLDEAELIETYK